MRGLLADVNVQGHLRYLRHLLFTFDLWGVLAEIQIEFATYAAIIKDGLKPGVVESDGLLGLQRLWGVNCWPFCLVVVPTHLVGWLFCWMDSRESRERPPSRSTSL